MKRFEAKLVAHVDHVRRQIANHYNDLCFELNKSFVSGLNHFQLITIKRVDDGRISNWFNDNVKPGDRLMVVPPAGLFVLNDKRRPITLFAGGSGITPCISIAKTVLSTTERKLRLVYANRDAASIIFEQELGEARAADLADDVPKVLEAWMTEGPALVVRSEDAVDRRLAVQRRRLNKEAKATEGHLGGKVQRLGTIVGNLHNIEIVPAITIMEPLPDFEW